MFHSTTGKKKPKKRNSIKDIKHTYQILSNLKFFRKGNEMNQQAKFLAVQGEDSNPCGGRELTLTNCPLTTDGI